MRIVTTLPGGLVQARRMELGSLSRAELRAAYAKARGHSLDYAQRSMLDPKLIIDLIIWANHFR